MSERVYRDSISTDETLVVSPLEANYALATLVAKDLGYTNLARIAIEGGVFVILASKDTAVTPPTNNPPSNPSGV